MVLRNLSCLSSSCMYF